MNAPGDVDSVDQAPLRPRHAWIDAAKAISILLVVLVHAGDWSAFVGIERGPVLGTLTSWAEYLRMPLFFTVSGLFARRWFTAGWRELLNRRLATLIWVFLVWQVAMVAYKYLAARTLPGQRDPAFTAHLLRGVVSPVRPNAELWFLWALVGYFLLARAVARRPRWLTLGVAWLVSLFWSSVVQTTVALPDSDLARVLGPGLVKVPMYFAFFLTAAVAAPAILDAVHRLRWGWAVAGLLPWVGLSALVDATSAYAVPGVTLLHQLTGVLAGISLAVLATALPGLGRGLVALGARTLPVYLLHSSLVVVAVVVLHLLGVGPLTGLAGSATVVALVALGVAGGLLLHRVALGSPLLDAPAWFRPGGRPRPVAPTPRLVGSPE